MEEGDWNVGKNERWCEGSINDSRERRGEGRELKLRWGNWERIW